MSTSDISMQTTSCTKCSNGGQPDHLARAASTVADTGSIGGSRSSYDGRLVFDGSSSIIGPQVYVIAPSEFERFTRTDFVDCDLVPCSVPPLKLTFSRNSDCSKDWVLHVHACGARYFAYSHKYFTVFTEADLYDPAMAALMATWIGYFEAYVSNLLSLTSIPLSEFTANKVDLVLDLTTKQSDVENRVYMCGYYFAHHETKTIFWLDEFPDAHHRLWWGIRGVRAELHQQHALHAQYWLHCSLFSCTRQPTRHTIFELRDILSYAIGDSLLSTATTAPFPMPDLEKMKNLVDYAISVYTDDSSSSERNTKHCGLSSIIFLLMSTFSRERLYHFHGEPSARLHRGKSVYAKEGRRQKRPLYFRMISAMFFNEPTAILNSLEQMVTDRIIQTTVWLAFVEKAERRWTELTFYSTVFLGVNTGFLTISSVDVLPNPSAAKIAAYLSTLASLGSLIFGMLLVGHTRAYSSRLKHAQEIAAYLEERHNLSNGYGTLAIAYSLPYSLLLWAVLAFVMAFSAVCITSLDILTNCIFTLAWLAIVTLTFLLVTMVSPLLCIRLTTKYFWMPLRRLRIYKHREEDSQSIYV